MAEDEWNLPFPRPPIGGWVIVPPHEHDLTSFDGFDETYAIADHDGIRAWCSTKEDAARIVVSLILD